MTMRYLAFVLVALAAVATHAQQPVQDAKLAPNPPGLTAKPVSEILLNRITLPPGFSISLWADGIPNARSIATGSQGTVFIGTRLVGSVYAVVDRGGKREVKIIAKGLTSPNGVVFRNGALYVAEISRILRFDNIEARLDNPPAPVVVFDRLPKDGTHGWKYMRLGPDGWLYFNIGAPCNACIVPDTHGQIARLNPDTGAFEMVARGVRNSVGMDFHPVSRELWFTNNGRDWIGDDLPADTLHRVSAAGMHFGFPFCHQGDVVDPEFGKGRTCAEFDKPALALGPHLGSLGMTFYTGGMFPPEFRNRIIVANHGSWNRSQKNGYNLVQVTLDASGKVMKQEPFATGWLQGESYWGRPADVHVMPDGALLVSDDTAGALYRITYSR